MARVGAASTGMPIAAEAVAASVPRADPSDDWTAAGVVLGGVAMVAVITTEPGVTSMVTSDTLTPADVAIEAAIAVVSA